MIKIVRIGRNYDNEVVISDNTASRYHCQIIQDDNGTYQIIDTESSNGTFVNGHKISGQVILHSNDVVRVGNTILPWNSYFQDSSSLNETTFSPHYPNTPPTPAAPKFPQDGVVVNVNQVVRPSTSPSSQAGYGSAPQPRKGSGFGVASFVLGLLGFNLLAIIFGIVSISRREPARGLGVAGLILGILWTIAAIILVVVMNLNY